MTTEYVRTDLSLTPTGACTRPPRLGVELRIIGAVQAEEVPLGVPRHRCTCLAPVVWCAECVECGVWSRSERTPLSKYFNC